MVHALILVAHVFLAIAIIGLVLLQRGKGADAGAGFGAGASGTVFGARGSATALSKATAVLATLFFVTSLALAFMGGRTRTEEPTSVLERAAQQSAPAPSEVPVPTDGSGQPPAAPATPGNAPAPTTP